jgi:hypothetical protein
MESRDRGSFGWEFFLLLLVLLIGMPYAAFADVILDNGGPGTSSTGTWRNSGGVNSYGTTSVYARPSATYTWQSALEPGFYEVSMWWTVVSSRGSNISVDVNGSDGVHTETIDQTTNGGQWNSIGTYNFGSSGSVTVTASSDTLPDGRTVSTCADAVRFVLLTEPIFYTISATANVNGAISPSGDISVVEGANQAFDIMPDAGYQVADVLVDGISVGAVTTYTFTGVNGDHTIAAFFEEVIVPTEIIIDNGGPGSSFTGTWRNSSGPNSYGTTSVYARPSATYSWQSSLQPGFYEVSMWWTVASSRGENVSVDIDTGSVIETITIDQTENGGQWNSIGTYIFDSSGSVTVTASSDTLPDGRIVSTCADAVRFILLTEPIFYTISATANVNGAISPSGDISVAEGSNQAFDITPDAGYQVADVLVDGISVGAVTTYTFTGVTGDHSIQASFEPFVGLTYTIAATAGANGGISPSGDITVNEGDDQAFDITPDSGYQVADVLVDGSSVGAVTTYTFIGVNGDHTIEAYFEVVIGPTEIIIDNGEPGSSYTGIWRNSSGANSYGATSVYARPSATYSWQFAPQPSYYEVLMWWTVASTRGENVSVDINTGSVIETVTIDQTENGGQWNSLGTYLFDATGGSVTVIASDDLLPDGRTVSTCADAVRFILLPVHVTVNTNGSGSVSLNPSGGVYTEGTMVELTAVADSGWIFDGWSGDITGNENPKAIAIYNDVEVTAIFTEIGNTPPIIDVWYGANQNFGHVGIPQRWINILGNVSDPDGVDLLRYALNGGPSVEATVAPNPYNKRLENPGDFNIEIAVSELVVGVNQLNLTARDLRGAESVRTITINFDNQNTWPSAYTINWSTAPSIPAVAQIVDGLWNIEGNTVRTVEPGFDRLIAIGDIAWTDYEVTVPVTVHWIDEDYTLPADAPNVGLICRWQGHTEDGSKPSFQWWPLGTFAAYRWWPYFQFQMFFVAYNIADNSGLDIDLGVEYIYKLRAETISNQSVYKLKVWRSSDPEPVNWLMDEGEGPYDLKNGSIMLVAHNADVSFGEVTIVPIQ